jgi:hypothetical protein
MIFGIMRGDFSQAGGLANLTSAMRRSSAACPP